MKAHLWLRIALTAGLALGLTAPALADEYTRIDFTDNSIGFTSPNNAYGPWIYQDARIVFVQPGQGAVNFEVAHENNGDTAAPTHGFYFAGGVTHDFTDRLYAYVNFGHGTDAPYARNNIHVEFNYKATSDLKLVVSGSEDFVSYYGGQSLKMTQLGPTYYYPGGDVQLRYVGQANSNAASTSGALLAWDITPTNRSKYSLTGLFGPQEYIVTTPGLPNALANYQGETFSVGTEQQLGVTSPTGVRWGITAQGFLSHLTESTTGAPVYTGRGASLGVWTTL